MTAVDIYVYYTIAVTDASRARQAVTSLQRQLGQSYDVAARVKRRVERLDGLQTWMEIYSQAPHGFEVVVEQLAAEAGLTALAQGKRHVEIFEDLGPCV